MILSQRYPMAFNGIISGDPAMRTGLSNLAIGRWIPIAFNQIAPKDSNGKPMLAQTLSDNDRKLVIDALLKQCDAKDGVVDGLISDPLACDFDPAVLACNKDEKMRFMPVARKSRGDQEGPRRPEDLEGNPGLSCVPLRYRRYGLHSDPRITGAGPRHLWTRNYGHGGRCR